MNAVAAALADFPIDRKAQEFDSAAAEKAGIYVAQHEREELKEYFGQLRNFYETPHGKETPCCCGLIEPVPWTSLSLRLNV